MALIRQEAARPRRAPRGARHAGGPREPALSWPPAPDRDPGPFAIKLANVLSPLNREVMARMFARDFRRSS